MTQQEFNVMNSMVTYYADTHKQDYKARALLRTLAEVSSVFKRENDPTYKLNLWTQFQEEDFDRLDAILNTIANTTY